MGVQKVRHTYEYVKGFIEGEDGNGCKLLSEEYFNTDEKLLIQCACSEVFEASFSKFFHRDKRQCNKCGKNIASENRKTPKDLVIRTIEEQGCKVISDNYKDTKTVLEISCSICGQHYFTSFKLFKRRNKNKCNDCSRKIAGEIRMKDISEMKNFIEVESLSGCLLLSTESNGIFDELKIMCKCGEIFYNTYRNFKKENQRSCLKCNPNFSKGEVRIMNYLNDNGVIYETQYSFEDCKSVYVLRFDFAIFHDSRILFLIEYQGRQHYQPIDYFGGEDAFIQSKMRDEIKINYCKENCIELLTIPYWDFDNIEKILEQELVNCNLIITV